MSPNFTSSYIKDLSKKPECIKEEITEVFFYLTNEGDLLKITEFTLIGSEYHYYSDIVLMGCSTQDFYSNYSLYLRELGHFDSQIINTLLALEMHEEQDDCLIGRIVYNDFTFIDNLIIKNGKQIKGITILEDYRSIGIARHIYKRLLIKYEYLICDNLQTLGGGSLWVSGMTKIGEVKIYDTLNKTFIDQLNHYGCGVSGIIPWSYHGLSLIDISKWEPRKLSMDCCHHIVNIISKDKIYKIDK
ncbi:hypothetical protein [Proteus appendicitidis]|uniref:N-acetyltransferase domain-containing protein n=1 Tax=Proteus appendicitidis TaxID=3034648 RepID=A0ABY8YA12_9GAMM|nr:hypothetical protein [Proteus sp. HZ0627]WIV88761.1 hypothetical protein QQS39_01765 [Proteus sp. HZ0627]